MNSRLIKLVLLTILTVLLLSTLIVIAEVAPKDVSMTVIYLAYPIVIPYVYLLYMLFILDTPSMKL